MKKRISFILGSIAGVVGVIGASALIVKASKNKQERLKKCKGFKGDCESSENWEDIDSVDDWGKISDSKLWGEYDCWDKKPSKDDDWILKKHDCCGCRVCDEDINPNSNEFFTGKKTKKEDFNCDNRKRKLSVSDLLAMMVKPTILPKMCITCKHYKGEDNLADCDKCMPNDWGTSFGDLTFGGQECNSEDAWFGESDDEDLANYDSECADDFTDCEADCEEDYDDYEYDDVIEDGCAIDYNKPVDSDTDSKEVEDTPK